MGKVPSKQARYSPSQARRDRARQLRTFRFLLILPFVATAVLLAPFAFLHKSSEVEISLKVSSISFVIGEPNLAGLFKKAIKTRSLTLLNFQEVELVGPSLLEIATANDPHTDAPSDRQPIEQQAKTRIVPRVSFASVTLEDVELNQLDVQPHSHMTLSWLEGEPSAVKFRLDGAETRGHIAVGRKLWLSCTGCEVSGVPAPDDSDSTVLRVTSEREHLVTFLGQSEGTTMALELPAGATLVAENISLERDVDFTQVEGRDRTSTIISDGGKITFEELKKEVPVRGEDFVILSELQDFFLRTLRLDNGINVTLHGRVGKLAVGPKGFVRDRLPSVLEWLYNRQTWLLYLNTLVLIGTTVLAILKRLKIVHEEEQ